MDSATVRRRSWSPEWHRRGVLLLLLASALALGIAPVLMPDTYSLVAHGTSDSAAQGVSWAWIARLGFLLFGVGVLWLAVLARPRWGVIGTSRLGLFGGFMVMASMFSTRSWESGATFDVTEDLLHSVAATAMGFAYTAGVVVVAIRRATHGARVRALDLLAVTSATVLPLVMLALPYAYGALQRPLFVIAYLWYGAEAIASTPSLGEGLLSSVSSTDGTATVN